MMHDPEGFDPPCPPASRSARRPSTTSPSGSAAAARRAMHAVHRRRRAAAGLRRGAQRHHRRGGSAAARVAGRRTDRRDRAPVGTGRPGRRDHRRLWPSSVSSDRRAARAWSCLGRRPRRQDLDKTARLLGILALNAHVVAADTVSRETGTHHHRRGSEPAVRSCRRADQDLPRRLSPPRRDRIRQAAAQQAAFEANAPPQPDGSGGRWHRPQAGAELERHRNRSRPARWRRPHG